MFKIKDYVVGEIIEMESVRVLNKILKERLTDYLANEIEFNLINTGKVVIIKRVEA